MHDKSPAALHITWTPELDQKLKNILHKQPVDEASLSLGIPLESVKNRIRELNRFKPKDLKEWFRDILQLDLCAVMGWKTNEGVSRDLKERHSTSL